MSNIRRKFKLTKIKMKSLKMKLITVKSHMHCHAVYTAQEVSRIWIRYYVKDKLTLASLDLVWMEHLQHNRGVHQRSKLSKFDNRGKMLRLAFLICLD